MALYTESVCYQERSRTTQATLLITSDHRDMSPSRDNAAEPARALNSLAVGDWEALRWRELVWDALPHPVKASTIPYLTVQEVGRLDSAMTNREARPHLVESYKGMQSPAFNSYRYEYRKGGDHKELQWARERGIDSRGFTLGYEGQYRAGVGSTVQADGGI